MNTVVFPPLYEGNSVIDLTETISRCLTDNKIDVRIISAPIMANTLVNTLDNAGYYQTQLALLQQLENVADGDRILFLDFFNPGLDLLRYQLELRGASAKLGALLHGSTFLKDDLYSWDWLQPYETAWWQTYEKVYAPSESLRQMLPEALRTKVSVVPWGLDGKLFPLPATQKIYDVVFPHRLDDDKGVRDLIAIAQQMPWLSFLITCPQPELYATQNKYYSALQMMLNVHFCFGEAEEAHLRTLSLCRVALSCARQENFGYAMMKAVACGCLPVVPDRLCYPEFYGSQYRYDDICGAVRLIQEMIDGIPVRGMAVVLERFSFSKLLLDFFND